MQSNELVSLSQASMISSFATSSPILSSVASHSRSISHGLGINGGGSFTEMLFDAEDTFGAIRFNPYGGEF